MASRLLCSFAGPWADLRAAFLACLVDKNVPANMRWFEGFFQKLRQLPPAGSSPTACPFVAKARLSGGIGKMHLQKPEGTGNKWLSGKATPGKRDPQAPRCANKFSEACKRVRPCRFTVAAGLAASAAVLAAVLAVSAVFAVSAVLATVLAAVLFRCPCRVCCPCRSLPLSLPCQLLSLPCHRCSWLTLVRAVV